MLGFSVGAQYQAGNSRAVAERIAIEFRVRVCRTLRMRAVPSFDHGRVDMVEPATPVVPGNEDRCFFPESAFHNRIDLLDCPTHAVSDILRRMFAEIRPAITVDPGNGG